MKLNDFIDWRLPSGATFSECRRYRHTLWRTTGDCQFGNERICCIIMLNPSTADQSTDDPTIRRCRGFARDWAYGRLAVINLFDFRATEPAELKKAEKPCSDQNDTVILTVAKASDLVVCAWGTHGEYLDRGSRVAKALRAAGVNLHLLAPTKMQLPRHPLYLKRVLQPIPWKSPRRRNCQLRPAAAKPAASPTKATAKSIVAEH